tara:strand:- start:52566 stop:53708 length:1143 start_codon:yes stop_codon:yes gene_type:complete
MRKLPYYVISALKKGLELHSKGLSGDGLRPSTVSAARRAVNSGSWSDEKIKKASAWLARHRFDRSRMKSPAKWDDPPKYSPAYVAWLLWGDSGNGKGKRWIDKAANKIDAKENMGARTPAPPSDRIKGGRNTGRAGTSGKGIRLSASTVKAIQNKVDGHNEKHGKDKRKRVTPSMLKKVYLRGAGAFSTSHRPNVTSRAQWAMARVNAFLYLLANLKPKRSAYVTDNDLLPKSHPKKSSRYKEGVESPNADQRKDLPSAAYQPTAFFDEDDNFLSSKSKLPHHVKSAKDPDEHDSVDIPRLRNALARFGQTDFSGFPDGTKTRSRAHLERHADALLSSRRYEGEKKDPQFERQIELLSMDMVDFRNGKYSLIAERIQNET